MMRTNGIIVVALIATAGTAAISAVPREFTLKSPHGRIQIVVRCGDADRLTYRVTLEGKPVIEPSALGIRLDGVDLGDGVDLAEATRDRLDETYPWRGVHSTAVNRYNGLRVSVVHKASKTQYFVDVRAFDDGLAFRTVVPGDDRARTPDEATTFRLPPGTIVWYHDFGGHYEGVHARKEMSAVPADDWAAPPLTFKLPQATGYGSITEGGLVDYAGLGLQADGRGGFAARLGHAQPVNKPYALRYPAEEAVRLAKPASVTGSISTPWRVILIGRDLNTLVNSDIIHNVSPPHDPRLYPKGLETDWIKPGRSVWRYLDGGDNTLDGIREFSNLAAQLGFEHHVVEGIWRKWTEQELRAFVEHAAKQSVGVWLWKDSRQLGDRDERRRFFQQCRDLGVVGVKVDFLDHEAKETIEHYRVILEDAAEFHLMVNFHGANKPTGQTRTWPNELTREGVYGLEHRSATAWAQLNATLPFTRYLAGPGDYTPVVFGERRRETSWAHQIATAAVFTSPLLVYGGHPTSLLENPAAEMIKSIPSVWDETRVLPGSEIGELAAFARRTGQTWYLAILNGPTARTFRTDLRFLGGGPHQALLVRDDPSSAAAVRIEKSTVTAATTLTVEMAGGGGFIARFVR